MGSFKTKGWWEYGEFWRHKSLTENGQTALRQDKEAAWLPSIPNTISGAFHGTQRGNVS